MGDISVAASIIDEHGRAVAAINISVATTRWTKERAEAELIQHVQVAATSISNSKFNRHAACRNHRTFPSWHERKRRR